MRQVMTDAAGELPALVRGLRDDGLFLAIAAIYFAAAVAMTDIGLTDFIGTTAGLFVLTVMVAACLRVGHYVLVSRPEHPVAELCRDCGSLLRSERIWTNLPALVSLALFVSAFVQFKVNIPLSGSAWDQVLTEVDRTIHFGKLPWEWLQPIVGYWPVTFVIAVNYQLWIVVKWAVVLTVLFTPALHPLRTRFSLCFLAVWIVGGSALATAFASFGPCYYEYFGLAPNPYLPLTNYLREMHQTVPVLAIHAQDLLLEGYVGNRTALGISAMPSMHNAIALLLVLTAWQYNHRLAAWLLVHAVLVFIGSIQLAWHYAVDAYAGWVLTGFLWAAAAPLSRWWDGAFAGSPKALTAG